MQKVIGLDLGTYSIKAVEIINTFKSYEITNFYEKVVPYNPDVSRDTIIPNIMEQLFVENRLNEADRIVTAMPGQYISSRIMTFNFSDIRKIEPAVLSELEDYVPFHLDEMIVDQQIIGQVDKKTIVLAVMTRKAYLASFLDNLKRINIDPRLVDIDSLAFYNLSSTMNFEPGTCTALVDCGHEKTSVCIVKDGVLRMFRTINLGGKFLTEFLMRDLEMTYQQAEAAKHRVSRVLNKGDDVHVYTKEDLAIAERLTLSINTIVKELGRTLYAFKTWDKTPVDMLLLSGGTAQITGIDSYLSDQLMLDVQINKMENTTLKINPDLSENAVIMPQSVSVGMRAISSIKRVSQINLRRGEFAYVQDYEKLMRFGNVAMSIFLAAVLLLSFSYGIHYLFYKHRSNKIQEQYTQSVEKYFKDNRIPGERSTSKKKDFKSYRKSVNTKFDSKIREMQNSIDDFKDDNSGSHALIALAKVSDAIPGDLKVDITTFDFKTNKDNKSLTLNGETDSYETFEKIVAALKKVKGFEFTEKTSSNPKPGAEKVIAFKIPIRFAKNYDHRGDM